eukprot:363451-Chlamydomonas_euryale.AAC.14
MQPSCATRCRPVSACPSDGAIVWKAGTSQGIPGDACRERRIDNPCTPGILLSPHLIRIIRPATASLKQLCTRAAAWQHHSPAGTTLILQGCSSSGMRRTLLTTPKAGAHVLPLKDMALLMHIPDVLLRDHFPQNATYKKWAPVWAAVYLQTEDGASPGLRHSVLQDLAIPIGGDGI